MDSQQSKVSGKKSSSKIKKSKTDPYSTTLSNKKTTVSCRNYVRPLSQGSSLLQSNLQQTSFNTSKQLDVSNPDSNNNNIEKDHESLEKIHTFSLKEQTDEESVENSTDGESSFHNRRRNISASSRNSSSSNRSTSRYVPDKVKVFTKELKHCEVVLSHLINI